MTKMNEIVKSVCTLWILLLYCDGHGFALMYLLLLIVCWTPPVLFLYYYNDDRKGQNPEIEVGKCLFMVQWKITIKCVSLWFISAISKFSTDSCDLLTGSDKTPLLNILVLTQLYIERSIVRIVALIRTFIILNKKVPRIETFVG